MACGLVDVPMAGCILSVLLTMLGVAPQTALAWSRSDHLRATARRHRQAGAASPRQRIPGWGAPAWGGRTFEDSLANYNPWGKVRPVPVVGNIDPTAPLDRVDKTWSDSLTNAVPLPPTDEAAEAHAVAPTMRADFIGPYAFPHTFPADSPSEEPLEADTPEKRMEDRNLMAAGDKLRPPYAWRSSGNYPLVAPADRIISSRGKALGWFDGDSGYDPWPVASSDRLPAHFSKYFQQVHDGQQRVLEKVRIDQLFDEADGNKDGSISPEEFGAELQRRQNKTGEEAQRLWGKYHTSSGEEMNKDEFARLARAGFDLGAISRSDIAAVLSLPGAPQRGFWGSGAKCPHGTYVAGARLKVMPRGGAGFDDTGLNGVGLRCTTGPEAATIEGPDGTWTKWAECPAGQQVFSVRARLQPFTPARDNAGLRGLEFGCRQADLSEFAELRFGAPPWIANPEVITGEGAETVGGGWTKEFMCPVGSSVCGAQAHVVRDQGKLGDNMGIADLRVFCCSTPVDCTAACSAAKGGPGSVGCQVCQRAAGLES